jgi:hypothetical protein
MLNYLYCCEINLRHPLVAKVVDKNEIKEVSNSSTSVTFTSQTFPDADSASSSMLTDLRNRLDRINGVINDADRIYQVRETSPHVMYTPEELEEQKKEDPIFATYLDTWAPNVVCRVVCTTEELKFDEDGSIDELPSSVSDKLIHAYVYSFDDGFDLPKGALVVKNYPSTLQ